MRAWFDSRDIGPIATTAPQQAHLACEAFLPSRRVADVTITNRINLESSGNIERVSFASIDRALLRATVLTTEQDVILESRNEKGDNMVISGCSDHAIAVADGLVHVRNEGKASGAREAEERVAGRLAQQQQQMSRLKQELEQQQQQLTTQRSAVTSISRELEQAKKRLRSGEGSGSAQRRYPTSKGAGTLSADSDSDTVEKFCVSKDPSRPTGQRPNAFSSGTQRYAAEGGDLKALRRRANEKTSSNKGSAKENNYSNGSATGHRDGGGGGGGVDKDDPLPPELAHLDKALVDRIESDIVIRGQPISFDDIAGLVFVKKSVREVICWPMARPDIFKGLRALPKGLLLFGPPGTGKTLIGKVILYYYETSEPFCTLHLAPLHPCTLALLSCACGTPSSLFMVSRIHSIPNF